MWTPALLVGAILSAGIGRAAADDVDLSSVPRAVLQSDAFRYLQHCRENPGNGVWDLVANRSVTCGEYLTFRRQLVRIYERVAFDEDPIIFKPDSTSTKVDELLFCRAHAQAKVVQFPFDKIQYACEGVLTRDNKVRGGFSPQDARSAAERAQRLEDEARRASPVEREAADARAREARTLAERLAKFQAERQREEAETRKRAAEAAEAEARQRTAEAEAAEAEARSEAAQEEGRRLRIAGLTAGLTPIDSYMDVAVETATVRELPERSAVAISTLPRSNQVHVIGTLPSGWVQIAQEGEPVGWIHRGALRPAAARPGTVAARPKRTAGATAVFAPRYAFPKGRPNPNGVAVIIGNRIYRHRDIPQVSFAHNDAEAMRQYVTRTLGYDPRNVVMLSDASQANLYAWLGTEGNIRGRLFDLIGDASEIFIFYSGHGVPGASGGGYLLPVDGDPLKPELTGYRVDTLVGNLNRIGAQSVILALDACFSGLSHGGALMPSASGIYLSPRLSGGLARGALLTAADGRQIASWDEQTGFGLFTRHLLEGLLGKADGRSGDGDGVVTLAEVKAYLQSEVTHDARRTYGRDQTPQVLGAQDLALVSITAPVFSGFPKTGVIQAAGGGRAASPLAQRDDGTDFLKRLFKATSGQLERPPGTEDGVGN